MLSRHRVIKGKIDVKDRRTHTHTSERTHADTRHKATNTLSDIKRAQLAKICSTHMHQYVQACKLMHT